MSPPQIAPWLLTPSMCLSRAATAPPRVQFTPSRATRTLPRQKRASPSLPLEHFVIILAYLDLYSRNRKSVAGNKTGAGFPLKIFFQVLRPLKTKLQATEKEVDQHLLPLRTRDRFLPAALSCACLTNNHFAFASLGAVNRTLYSTRYEVPVLVNVGVQAMVLARGGRKSTKYSSRAVSGVGEHTKKQCGKAVESLEDTLPN